MRLNYFLKDMIRLVRSPRAESLGEVIIALTVISIVAAGVSVLLHIQMRGSTRIKYRTETYVLAREGAELVKNLLETNALRFPGNLEDCWDTIDATSAQTCAASTKLTNGTSYRVDEEMSDNTRWGEINALSITSSTDTLLYEHVIAGNSVYNHQAAGGTATPFHRTVMIEKSQTFATSSSDDTLVVTSTVTWELFGQTQSTEFSLTRFNP